MTHSAVNRSSNMTLMLSVMMFLQFFTWGAWFATLGLALTKSGMSQAIGGGYGAAPLAAILAPLFLGLVADRFFASQKVMGVLMLVGGAILLAVPSVATQPENANLLVWLILAHMLCYMPTLGLSNTIAFTHIPSQDKFPMIRVWGTIGWIVAGLLVGITGWDGTLKIFTLGGISALLLGLFCFFLPNTPPPLKDRPIDARSLLMVDAFGLLANWNFLVFAICSTLICIPLAYYYGSTSQFLGQTGFVATGATMTLGQMSEIFFMLLIPVFFRRLGVKMMILVGMACWVIRYLLFSYGASAQTTWILLLAVALHGICYDFFFVTGFMYTDQKAPKEIRGQAQGLLVFLTQGVGMFFGYRIMAAGGLFGIPLNFTIGQYGQQVTQGPQLTAAIDAARGQQQLGFLETFGKMFSRALPESIDPGLLTQTMEQWKNFWMFPAIMAAGVLILFGLTFWDKTQVDDA
ncbi:MAG: MFS transporter [Pirellulaceae bacterium]|nr:MFS transporter [Pirellulaceae bacterium]